MSTARDTIEKTLRENNVPMTYDEVAAEMMDDIVFGSDIAGAVGDEQEEAVLRHLPAFLVKSGFDSTPGIDPTSNEDPTKTDNTASSGPSLPEVDSFTYEAISRQLDTSDTERQRVSDLSRVTEVLIDKDYPGDWIHVESLPVKGEAANIANELKNKRKEGEAAVLLNANQSFIPTKQQMEEGAEIHNHVLYEKL